MQISILDDADFLLIYETHIDKLNNILRLLIVTISKNFDSQVININELDLRLEVESMAN